MIRAPLLHFLLLGGLLFGLETASSRDREIPVVEIRLSELRSQIEAFRSQMGRLPDEQERAALERQVIERAIWLEEAWARGLQRMDPVVQQRLVLNMRFLEGDPGEDGHEADADELLDRALELGMARSDPVVQRRLVDRAQAVVRARVRARPIDEAALARHYRETASRWREPPLLDLTHVYLSRDKRGETLSVEADRLLERLRDGGIEPEVAVREGDPFLAGHRLRLVSPTRITSRLGPAFEAAVRAAPVDSWLGPVGSAFGLHAVWIHERVPGRLPPLAEIRPKVQADWQEAETRRALREHVRRRRAEVELRFLDDLVDDRLGDPLEGPGEASSRTDSARSS